MIGDAQFTHLVQEKKAKSKILKTWEDLEMCLDIG